MVDNLTIKIKNKNEKLKKLDPFMRSQSSLPLKSSRYFPASWGYPFQSSG